MLNKKLVLATALGAVAFGATAFAGGPGEYAAAPSVAGLYLEGNVGYAWRNWQDMYYWNNPPGGMNTTTWSSNGKGGFAAIVDAGYQFNEYFSAEMGWIYMTPPKANTTVNQPGSDRAYRWNDGSTWTLYFGGKIQAPIYDDQTFIFGKLAAAYNRNHFSSAMCTYRAGTAGTSCSDVSSNYWSPLFAAGIQRYFSPNLSANIQYTFIPAYTDAGSSGSGDFNVPQSHILTVGVGYKFLM